MAMFMPSLPGLRELLYDAHKSAVLMGPATFYDGKRGFIQISRSQEKAGPGAYVHSGHVDVIVRVPKKKAAIKSDVNAFGHCRSPWMEGGPVKSPRSDLAGLRWEGGQPLSITPAEGRAKAATLSIGEYFVNARNQVSTASNRTLSLDVTA
ncbi:hypothetical protein KM043_014122 [Ampulex compressa]|nr:hypothetical protein KM043_014122 [Ampulex compressa]